MARRYDSFVVRCWQRGGERRVEVEHLQSGGRICNATFAAAIDWIGAQWGEPDDQVAATRGPPAAGSEEVSTGEQQAGEADCADGPAPRIGG